MTTLVSLLFITMIPIACKIRNFPCTWKYHVHIISIIKIEDIETIKTSLWRHSYSAYVHTYSLFIQNVMITYPCIISIIKIENNKIIKTSLWLHSYSTHVHTHNNYKLTACSSKMSWSHIDASSASLK